MVSDGGSFVVQHLHLLLVDTNQMPGLLERLVKP